MSNRKLEVVTVNGHNEVVTTTQEHAEELVNQFFDNSKTGLEMYIKNCLTLAELRATKGYLLLGYKSFYSDKGKGETPLLQALFGSDSDSDTEAKNMCLLATTFGKKVYDEDKNSLDKWELDDTTMHIMTQLSKGVLFELPALKECKDSNQDLKELLESLGVVFNENNDITETTLPLTVKGFRQVKALERKHKCDTYALAIEAEEKLQAQAKALVESKEAEDTSEPTESTEDTTEPTESTEDTTEPTESTEDTTEPTEDTVEELVVTSVSLKDFKNLVKKGDDIVIIRDGQELYLHIME